MNISFISLLWIDVFISFDKHLGAELLSHRVAVCLTLLKNRHTVVQSGLYMSSVASHFLCCPILVPSASFILATLEAVKWQLSMVLICIFLGLKMLNALLCSNWFYFSREISVKVFAYFFPHWVVIFLLLFVGVLYIF